MDLNISADGGPHASLVKFRLDHMQGSTVQEGDTIFSDKDIHDFRLDLTPWPPCPWVPEVVQTIDAIKESTPLRGTVLRPMGLHFSDGSRLFFSYCVENSEEHAGNFVTAFLCTVRYPVLNDGVAQEHPSITLADFDVGQGLSEVYCRSNSDGRPAVFFGRSLDGGWCLSVPPDYHKGHHTWACMDFTQFAGYGENQELDDHSCPSKEFVFDLKKGRIYRATHEPFRLDVLDFVPTYQSFIV